MIRYRIRSLLILTTIGGFLFAGVVYVRAAIQTRVVASVDHPNGARLRVIQEFNYQPELITTSIYFDDGDGRWRWYYFDHQDFDWGTANSDISGSRVLVGDASRRIELDTITGECTTIRSGRKRSVGKSDRIEALPVTPGNTRDQNVNTDR